MRLHEAAPRGGRAGTSAKIARRSFLGAIAATACTRRPAATGAIGRVISLSPSTTEAVFAIGQGERLVGRSRYCDYPPAALALPAVGGYVDASFEVVLGLRPDLVVGEQGPGGRALVDRLSSKGIDTYFPPTTSLDEITLMLIGLGKRLGAAGPADDLVRLMAADRARIEAWTRDRPRPRVVLLFGLEPIVAAGVGSFADEVLRRAGATNAVASLPVERTTPFPKLGFEQLLALDPDVLVHAAMEEDASGVRPTAWEVLRAVKTKRVRVIRDERVLRPGPRIIEGLDVLARAIHEGEP